MNRIPMLLTVVALGLLVACDGESEAADAPNPTSEGRASATLTPTPWLPGMPTLETTFTPAPTPERPVPAVAGEVSFCGFSIAWWDQTAPNTAARQCFLDGSAEGSATLVIAEWGPDRSTTTRLTSTDGVITGTRAILEGDFPPDQRHVTVECAPLQPTSDEWVFEPPECDETGDYSAEFDDAASSEQFCGLSQVLHSSKTANAGARQCLLDAFESGSSASLIEVSITVEGDPIAEVVQVSGGHVTVYMDSHDSMGYEGAFTYECDGLTASSNGSVFQTEGCSEPQPISAR